MTNTKEALTLYIEGKIERYVKIFDVLPDILIISKDHYELVKHNAFVTTLRVIIEPHLDFPIVLKK